VTLGDLLDTLNGFHTAVQTSPTPPNKPAVKINADRQLRDVHVEAHHQDGTVVVG